MIAPFQVGSAITFDRCPTHVQTRTGTIVQVWSGGTGGMPLLAHVDFKRTYQGVMHKATVLCILRDLTGCWQPVGGGE